MATEIPLPWSHLDGRIVMVTGASSGLGLEFCLNLAKARCRLVVAARRINRLNSLCDQINKMDISSGSCKGNFCRAIAVELDVAADDPTIEACVERAWNAFGHIDALINNAGVRGPRRSSLDLPKEEWENVVKTNLTGSWLVAKYLGARMRDRSRGGSIINISSIFGLNRIHFRSSIAYSTSKSGLNCMTKVMALELGDYNIRVNSIASSLFKSEMTEELFRSKLLENVVKATVPLRTLGTSDPALTLLIRYLLHDSSSYVTGNIFIVDAGASLPAFPIFSSL